MALILDYVKGLYEATRNLPVVINMLPYNTAACSSPDILGTTSLCNNFSSVHWNALNH